MNCIYRVDIRTEGNPGGLMVRDCLKRTGDGKMGKIVIMYAIINIFCIHIATVEIHSR